MEIPLRNGTEEKLGVQEIKAGGWKEDLARMGFEVPIEEIDQGQIVGQKWLIAGGRPGFLGAKVFFLASGDPEKVAKSIFLFDPTGGKRSRGKVLERLRCFRKYLDPLWILIGADSVRLWGGYLLT